MAGAGGGASQPHRLGAALVGAAPLGALRGPRVAGAHHRPVAPRSRARRPWREDLRTLFWNNVVGRFTHVASPAALDYTSGHHNIPGKYLFELPLYLLPWTLVVAAALRRAWTRARAAASAGSAWRFALCASVPFLVLLSLAATARDIYAAPALLGFALLAGLWVHEAQRSPDRIDRLALSATATLVVVSRGSLRARSPCWVPPAVIYRPAAWRRALPPSRPRRHALARRPKRSAWVTRRAASTGRTRASPARCPWHASWCCRSWIAGRTCPGSRDTSRPTARSSSRVARS